MFPEESTKTPEGSFKFERPLPWTPPATTSPSVDPGAHLVTLCLNCSAMYIFPDESTKTLE